jgi:hypothetical protein
MHNCKYIQVLYYEAAVASLLQSQRPPGVFMTAQALAYYEVVKAWIIRVTINLCEKRLKSFWRNNAGKMVLKNGIYQAAISHGSKDLVKDESFVEGEIDNVMKYAKSSQ